MLVIHVSLPTELELATKSNYQQKLVCNAVINYSIHKSIHLISHYNLERLILHLRTSWTKSFWCRINRSWLEHHWSIVRPCMCCQNRSNRSQYLLNDFAYQELPRTTECKIDHGQKFVKITCMIIIMVLSLNALMEFFKEIKFIRIWR